MKTFLQEEANETTTESYCPPELYSFGGILEDTTIDERVDIWVSLQNIISPHVLIIE